MIPAAMLMYYKVLAIMINNQTNICIFASLPRGSGQRRGTTRERLEVDKGRLLIACRFDPSRTLQCYAPFYFFLGFMSGVFLTGLWLIFAKFYDYHNVDSIKSITFAAFKIKIQVIMCQLQIQVYANETAFASNKRLFERIVYVNDSCSIPYETIAKAVAFLFGLDVVLIYKLTLK